MINETQENLTNKKKRINSREKSKILFYISIVFLPLLQNAIFYVYVNFNSLKMAFFTYHNFEEVFCGVDNFKNAWKLLVDHNYWITNVLKAFLVGRLVGDPLSLFFSYYIFKKLPWSGTFKVLLFLPHVISSLIFAFVFKFMVTDVYPYLTELLTHQQVNGLLDNAETQFGTILFYCIWSGFGLSMLLFSGAMSGVSNDILESGQLDGTNLITEFIYLIFPSIWSTYSSLFIVGIAGLCGNQLSLHAMYGVNAPGRLGTIGYYLFVQQQYLAEGQSSAFGELSALGLLLSVFMVPLSLSVRKLMQKIGPKEE